MSHTVPPSRMKEVRLNRTGRITAQVEVAAAALPDSASVAAIAYCEVGAKVPAIVVVTDKKVLVADKRSVRWSAPLYGLRSELREVFGLRLISPSGPDQQVRLQGRGKLAAVIEERARLSDRAPVGFGATVQFVRGLQLRPGMPCEVEIMQDAVSLKDAQTGALLASASGDEIVEFRAGGPGLLDDGLNLVGGGFGVKGAATGIASAGALNQVFAGSQVQTTVRLATPHWTVILLTHEQTVEQIEAIAPVVAPASPARPPTLAEGLRELARLKDEGILSDDEFERSKNKLIEG